MSGFAQDESATESTTGNQIQFGSATKWLDGKDLQKARLLPISVSWTESPLRPQLMQFGNQRQRPIFIDRRVDPTLKQTLQLFDVTTEQVVWRIAKDNDLGVARIGNLLYIGPKSSASRLTFAIAAAKKKLSRQNKDVRKKWNRKSDIVWQNATTTTEVARWFEQTHGIGFREPIPFDVWPAMDLPKLTLLEQMSLVLVGFDLTFEVDKDDQTISLVKFPVIENGSRKFRFKEEPFDLRKARTEFPDLKFATSGKTLSVKGSVDQLAELEAWVVEQQRVKQSEGAVRTFDLNTTARRGDILNTVAQQTGRKLALSGRANELLAKPITVNLEKVTLESLIATCLDGTGLTYRLSETTLTISDN